jgi:hypothetical protein
MRVAEIFSIRLPGVSSRCWRFENRVWEGRPFAPVSYEMTRRAAISPKKKSGDPNGIRTHTPLFAGTE